MPRRLYRANWRLSGLRGRNLAPEDTIELTDEEAAPYVGGALSPVDEAAQTEPQGESQPEQEGDPPSAPEIEPEPEQEGEDLTDDRPRGRRGRR